MKIPDHYKAHADAAFREHAEEWLKMTEQRLERELPEMRSFIKNCSFDQISEFFLVVDLLAHFIDTEEKLAKKILKQDYIASWMKTVRSRLRRQAKAKKETGVAQ